MIGFSIALFCLHTVALPAASTALPSYFTRGWRTEEGLPQNSVTALAQTRDGYLWQGTYGGLARFDGDTFTVTNVVIIMFAMPANAWVGSRRIIRGKSAKSVQLKLRTGCDPWRPAPTEQDAVEI